MWQRFSDARDGNIKPAGGALVKGLAKIAWGGSSRHAHMCGKSGLEAHFQEGGENIIKKKTTTKGSDPFVVVFLLGPGLDAGEVFGAEDALAEFAVEGQVDFCFPAGAFRTDRQSSPSARKATRFGCLPAEDVVVTCLVSGLSDCLAMHGRHESILGARGQGERFWTTDDGQWTWAKWTTKGV